jgi:hypothetical protein
MKFAIGVILFIWLLCGVIGAWWLDDLDRRHLKEIALGPITLVDAWNANPVNVPGP